MRLLLTADVHLTADHPERLAALREVVGLAESEGVDLLLLAGDLFDASVDVEAIKPRIRDLFTGTGVRTFVIPGNHDENAFREEDYFGDDIEVLSQRPVDRVELDGVNLVGVPYGVEDFGDLLDDLRAAREDAAVNLLLLHGTLSTATGGVFGEESRYLPFTPEQLVATGFEYVFAGHIHASPTTRTFGDDGECVFAYPGSPVSITRGETERRGVWLVDTDGGGLRQLDVDSVHYVRETLDLEPGGAPQALDRLEARLADRDLDGATVLVEPAGFIEMDEAAFFRALTRTVEAAGADDYEIDRTNVESARAILDSTLYRQFEAKLEARDDVDARAVRRLALRALSAEERA